MLPLIALVILVLGSSYGGITSITEAAGIGVVGALAIIAARRELNRKMPLESITQTFRAVGTIIWVTFGATILAGAHNLSGGLTYVANLIIGSELPPLGVIFLMTLIFILLGMFMDWIGMFCWPCRYSCRS